MTYMDKGIIEIHKSLKEGKVTSKELINEALKKSHELQEECNAFVTILDDAAECPVLITFYLEYLMDLRTIILQREFYQLVHLIH